MSELHGKGKLITRLLGRLEIFHGDGVIEFRLRSPEQIRKRKVTTVLRITGLDAIPRIEDGYSVNIDLKERDAEVHFDRRERGERIA